MSQTIQALTGEGDPREVYIDSFTHILPGMSSEHHHCHHGDHWFIKTYMDIDKSVTPTSFMMFNTPPLPVRVHAKASLATDGEFTIKIYKDAIISDTGVPIVAQNNDQNITTPPALIPSAAPTVTDVGSLIWAGKVGISKTAGVSQNLNYEIMAKSDSNYLYEIIKEDAGVNWLDVDFWWYEEASKEI